MSGTPDARTPPPNPLARSITYTFAPGEIDALVGERLAHLGKTARINGFRPGHVPMRVMRGRWGGRCLAEVLSEKAGARFAEESAAMSERPASSPQMTPSAVAAEDGYRVECRYEAMPEVAAPDLSAQKIRRPALEIGDAEVDEMIARLRRDSAEYAEVARAARSDDLLDVNFRARRGDAIVEEEKNRRWILDSPMLKGEVADALLGASAGDSREVALKHDDNHPDESLRGTETRMEIHVNKVSEPRLPELDGEFFARFGVKDGGDAFRKMVGARLKTEVEQRMRRVVHDQAMNALLAATPKFDLPYALVRMEAASMHSRMLREARARGLPQASAKMAPRMFSEAARRVALGLIIAGWREREKIEISDADVDARLDEIAGGYEDPAEFKTRARRDEQMMHALRLEMLERRAAEWVCARADTSDEKTSLSQLLSGDGGADA
ncbi:MAG: trigger factor [Gammaproteobacteria bacterium]